MVIGPPAVDACVTTSLLIMQRRRQTTTGPTLTGKARHHRRARPSMSRRPAARTRPPRRLPSGREWLPRAMRCRWTAWVTWCRPARLLEGEIGVLVDALAAAGTSWPAIAGLFGGSRQAARQAHNRPRAGSSPVAGSSAVASTG